MNNSIPNYHRERIMEAYRGEAPYEECSEIENDTLRFDDSGSAFTSYFATDGKTALLQIEVYPPRYVNWKDNEPALATLPPGFRLYSRTTKMRPVPAGVKLEDTANW